MKKLVVLFAILSLGCPKKEIVNECDCESYSKYVYTPVEGCNAKDPLCPKEIFSQPVYYPGSCEDGTDGQWVEQDNYIEDGMQVSHQKLIECNDKK